MSEVRDEVEINPRNNPHLVGQEAAEQTLLDSWNADRLVHAWLLTGPRGIGKSTLAYRFARFVLGAGGDDGGLFGGQPALRPDSLALDPSDPVFRRVAAGGHADLKTVERTPNPKTGKLRTGIVVDDVREVKDFMRLTPAEGGWRVAIVDAADEMNTHAANAILKILEEPPERALLMLVCHAPGRLLPTIVSRCRRLPMHALDESVVADLLAQHLPDLPADDRTVLARLGEGSIGEALALADAGGLELYDEVVRLMGSLGELDVERVHKLGALVSRRGSEDKFATLRRLIDRWLGAMIASAARGEALPEAIAGEAQVRRDLLARAPLEQWLGVWEKVTDLMARAEGFNLDRKQVVISAFISLAAAAGKDRHPH